MTILADTSALYALLDREDGGHARVDGVWRELVQADERILVHNYVIVEWTALTQRRLGLDAVRTAWEVLVPAMEIVWVDRDVHDNAMTALIASSRPAISLVDRVSFELMRRLHIDRAFSLDGDFRSEGFDVVPA